MDTDALLYRIEQLENQVENLREQLMKEYEVEDIVLKILIYKGLIKGTNTLGED
jgi:hypothetical protein